jgi:trehalose 6-phosphate synthase
MPAAERKERHAALKAKVFQTTAQVYCQRFLDALAARSLVRAAA